MFGPSSGSKCVGFGLDSVVYADCKEDGHSDPRGGDETQPGSTSRVLHIKTVSA
jgi:hypothetical protein